MINTKKELVFYMMADNMMNRGVYNRSFKQKVKEIISPDYVMKFLRYMRKTSYYRSKNCLKGHYYSWQYRRLGVKLGFSIGENVFGYGLVIPHYGTIVVGPTNTIGNYAVIHTSTCITSNGKNIGNNFAISTGAKITSGRELGNNVIIAANSVVSKSFPDNNVLLAGVPACVKSNSDAWWKRDEIIYKKFGVRVEKCEELKKKLGL